MIENMPFVWLAVIIIAILIEATTYDLVTIWFIPSGVILLILSLLPISIPIWLQVLIFFVIAAIFIVLSKTLLKPFFKKKPIIPTNLDAIPGKEAVVIEEINNLVGTGAVKVSGKIWSAVTESDDEKIEKDELVIIKEIRGVKLVCEKTGKHI